MKKSEKIERAMQEMQKGEAKLTVFFDVEMGLFVGALDSWDGEAVTGECHGRTMDDLLAGIGADLIESDEIKLAAQDVAWSMEDLRDWHRAIMSEEE